MTKEEWCVNHIVTYDDFITTTSPVFQTLEMIDDCRDFLRKLADEIFDSKLSAINAVTNGHEQLTAKEWFDKYIDPISNMMFGIDNAIEELADKRIRECEVVYE